MRRCPCRHLGAPNGRARPRQSTPRIQPPNPDFRLNQRTEINPPRGKTRCLRKAGAHLCKTASRKPFPVPRVGQRRLRKEQRYSSFNGANPLLDFTQAAALGSGATWIFLQGKGVHRVPGGPNICSAFVLKSHSAVG